VSQAQTRDHSLSADAEVPPANPTETKSLSEVWIARLLLVAALLLLAALARKGSRDVDVAWD